MISLKAELIIKLQASLFLIFIVCGYAQDVRGTQSVPPEAEKTPVKRSPPHIRQHYTQARTGVSLLKSPVIKITKVPRRQLETTLHSNLSMNEEPVGAAAVSLSVSEPSAAAVSLPSVNEPSARCSGSAGVEREAVLRRSPRHKKKWKGGTKEHGRKETLKSVSACMGIQCPKTHVGNVQVQTCINYLLNSATYYDACIQWLPSNTLPPPHTRILLTEAQS